MQTFDPSTPPWLRGAPPMPHVRDAAWEKRHTVYLAQQRLERTMHRLLEAAKAVRRARRELTAAQKAEADLARP